MSELDAPAPAAPPDVVAAAPQTPPPEPQRLPIRFTGAGGEYFRIWIVNLLLTLVTLGIWSAWAKVRKTRYFWNHTQLAGAAFQYHGNPVAILRGRILAGALVVAYSVAGRLSVTAGLVAAGVLVVLGPWFFYKSMRFKLANTSWRGLRFGFDSSAREAYGVLAPALVVVALFVAALVSNRGLAPGERPEVLPFLAAELALFGLWPWLHARLKAYQHGRARYGDLGFEFEPSAGAVYGLYGKTFLLAVPFFLVYAAAMAAVMFAFTDGFRNPRAVMRAFVPAAIAGYALLGVGYGTIGAFFNARLQRLVWTRTLAGPLRFRTSIRARGLMRVWLVNGLLTLITVGLYWPWAAVAFARYRLECMTVEACAPFDFIAAGHLTLERSTTGEGAVDFFGWDIGL